MTPFPQPLLVTRPSPDGEATCEAFEKVGIEVVHTPLMTIAFAQAPKSLPIKNIGALAFTSASGVRAWCTIRDSQTSLVPIDIPAFYVGPASAAVGEAADLKTAGIAAGDVDSLAALIKDHGLGPILHIQGVHAAGDLGGQLTKAGISATALPLYEAVAADALPPRAADALKGGPCTAALFSPRTARLFAGLVEDAGLTPMLGQSVAACLSENVANMARTLPFHEIVVAAEPQLASFVDMIKARCP